MPTNMQRDWLKKMVPAAQTTARQWGVPASVTLAQCVLESSWGCGPLAQQANNYFGIKAVSGQDYAEFPTHEVVQGRSVAEQAHFARYGTVLDCFAAHAHLLAASPRYGGKLQPGATVARWCAQLQAGGYSTNPDYAQTLLSLVRQLDLMQYDVPAGAPPAGGVA